MNTKKPVLTSQRTGLMLNLHGADLGLDNNKMMK